MKCLDTNIIIDYFRGDKAVQQIIIGLEDEEIYITYITLMELYAGCSTNEKRQKIYELVDKFITEVKILDFNIKACKLYGELYNILRLKGKTSQVQDIIIAAVCLEHNSTLITSNKKHFQNIPGLKVEYV
jgi:tRNA(fMet)-specific endonuclease VapC